MKKRTATVTVPHDVTITPHTYHWEDGTPVEGAIVTITGPGLPGIDYPYEDVLHPEVVKTYTLAEMRKKATTTRKALWGNYWQTGQLCLLTGDMGTGKSTLAIQLGKAIATGTNLMDYANDSEAQKVLYLGFELEGEEFFMRYGEESENTNFCYANLLSETFLPGVGTTPAQKLLRGIETMLKESEAKVVIIDQPDRLHISPQWWSYFMLKLNELKVQQGLSILITLNNKPRNINKAPAINNMYKSNLLAQHADSIVAIANHCESLGHRYIKSLKNNRQPLPLPGRPVEVFSLTVENNYFLLQPCGKEKEEEVLPVTKARRRQYKMMEAEALRHEGMAFKDIAIYMELPESTIRSWTRFIKVTETLSVKETHDRLFGKEEAEEQLSAE